MLIFKATPVSIQDTTIIFRGEGKGDFPEQEEIEFITACFKPINRGGATGEIHRDPAEYIYEPLNFLFAMYPTETQYKIFRLYCDIAAEISDFRVLNNLNGISAYVRKIFAILSQQMIDESISRNKDIFIPELNNDQYSRSIIPKPYSGMGLASETFGGSDDSAQFSEYKTEDYKGLLSLSIIARAMMPIFGNMREYLDEGVADKFSNFTIFKVIYSSWVQECTPMNKYRHYLDYQISQKGISAYSAIMEGLSELDLPEYVAAETFIKKMGVFDLYKVDPNHNLIKAVYNYATNGILGTLDKRFSGSIRGKTPPSEKTTMNGEDDKSGVLEDNITKADIRIGDRVTEDYLVSTVDIKRLLESVLDREVSKEEIKLCEEIIHILRSFEPDGLMSNFRDSITANLCATYMSPEMHPYLESEACYKNQGVAITKLIINKHYDVAALAMSSVNKEMSEWNTGSLSRITKENLDEIFDLYKLWNPVSSANKSNSFFNNYVGTSAPHVLTDKRYNNPGSQQIQFWVSKLLIKTYYDTHIPFRFLELCTGASVNGSSNYQKPTNINNILASLVIQIAKENQIGV